MAISTAQFNQDDRKLIDAIIYLSSLVSDPKVIDPWLDSVRMVTVKMQPGQAITVPERTELLRVLEKLTTHLLHHDTMRSFTEADLQTQIADKLGLGPQGPRRHESILKVVKIIVAAIVSYPIGAGIVALAGLPNPLLFGSVFATTALHAGLIWLYWSSLGTFTPALQKAYRWICYSMVGLCVAAATSPLLSAFPHLGDIPMLSYGGIVVYFAAPAFMLTYHGMRLFAKSLEIKTIFAAWPFSLALTAAGWLLLVLLPHVAVPNEIVFDSVQIIYVLIALYTALVGILGFKISRNVTSRYARAAGWLAASCVQVSVMCLGVVALIFLTGPVYAGPKLTIIGAVFGSSMIPMLISGYNFSRSVGKS